jgi:hypothetical protein
MARSKKIRGALSLDEWQSLNRSQRRQAVKDGWLPPMAGGSPAGDVLESNIFGYWAAMQPAGRGTPADMTVGSKFLRTVGGDLTTARTDGTEDYSDNSLFGPTVDFVNTILGNGSPVIQGQSGPLAWLHWLACGQEAVTGGSHDVQTLSSAATSGDFGLTMNGYATPVTIPFDATAAEVEAAFLTATNLSEVTLPAGSVVATGGPLPGTPVVLTSAGPMDFQPWPTITVNQGTTDAAPTIVHTTVGSGFQHVATPADSGGFWSTWFKSVGRAVQVMHKYNDCRIPALRTEGSSASKVVKVTPTLISLDPGEIGGAVPTKGDDNTIPFIYTEGAGSWVIDNIAFEGHSAFSMEGQWGLSEWYGDDVVPFAIVNTRATLALQAITVVLDDQGLGEFNYLIYGQRNPPVGTKPAHSISPLGSYACQFSKRSPYTGLVAESAKYEVPSVKWDPGLSIAANVAGGPVELPLAAAFRKVAGQPPFRVTTVNADPAYTA